MSQISRRKLVIAGAGVSALPLFAIGRRASAQETVMGDAYSVLASDERFQTWTQLIDIGGLQPAARGYRPFTVFPVTDDAFNDFPAIKADLVGYLQNSGTHNAQDAFPDTSKIVRLVRSHVLSGKHYFNEMTGKKTTYTTVAGTPLSVDATATPTQISWNSVDTGQLLVASLLIQPITCTNAVIYPLDKVHLG